MDMSPYRDLFVSEARGHLSAFSELIVHLEDSPGDDIAVNELFRHAHSLKGMAATMGYEQLTLIAHHMEDHLSRVRSSECPFSPPLADLLLEGCDTLSRLVVQIEAGDASFEDTSPLLERLASFDAAAVALRAPSVVAPRDPSPRSEQVIPALHQFRQSDSLNNVRVKTDTLNRLVNITGELITSRYHLAEAIRLADAPECDGPLRQLTLLLRTLRDEVFKVRMLPFSVIAERFPRLVRDLARKQGKEVQLRIEGKEIELDRGILEELAEPLVHILRNAVDHGLEGADDRVMAGKPFTGTITLSVERDKDHVEISIADDGRGMDPERLKRLGVERGVITPEQSAVMTDQEAFQLVCTPGFSTAAAVTDISGRGVGMDAVREAVHGLAGVLTIYSDAGQGSRFVLRLPSTVSIINALMVTCGPYEMAFPVNAVVRTVELQRTEAAGSDDLTMMIDDEAVPVRSLRAALHLPELHSTDATPLPVVICAAGGTPLAFAVDSISGQQEIFVRPLAAPLSRLRGISGATVSGDGRVLFVVDAHALV